MRWHIFHQYFLLAAEAAANARLDDANPLDVLPVGGVAIALLKLVKIIQDAGVKVVPLSEEGRKAFIAKTAGVAGIVKGKGASSKQVVELIQAGIADFRNKSRKGK